MKGSQFLKQKKRLFIKKKSPSKTTEVFRAPVKETKETPSPTKKPSVFKKYEIDLQLVLIPLILIIILSSISLVNKHFSDIVAQNKITPIDASIKMEPYPFLESITLPTLSAKAAIILDANSQVILFAKNAHVRFSMASTTKIMTALTALDYYKPDSILTIKSVGVGGSGLGLAYGDRFYFESLLYAMLLPSANDAAQAIADNYPGGDTAFVKKMNEKAAQLHLANTHFSDSTGLDDDGDYTTPLDMAHLASYAIKDKRFTQVTSTRERIITDISGRRQYALENLNKLLGVDGVTGIKTGTTEGAGEVLVTSTVENGHTFILVVMNSQDRFTDTEILLNFISQSVKFVSPDTLQF